MGFGYHLLNLISPPLLRFLAMEQILGHTDLVSIRLIFEPIFVTLYTMLALAPLARPEIWGKSPSRGDTIDA